jgi:hypothetical protein
MDLSLTLAGLALAVSVPLSPPALSGSTLSTVEPVAAPA